MLEFREVSYARGRRTFVDCVDLTFVPGTITVLLGPRGAGKTSVLRLLAGELAPTSGCILLDGRSVARQPHSAIRADARAVEERDVRRVVARDTEYVLLDERHDVP